MKRNNFILKFIIASLVLLIPGSRIIAQDSENALLWKIEGNGIKTSYLYGTFHMLPQKDFVLKESVKNSFEKAELIVMEIDMDDPGLQTEMMKNTLMKDGVTLDQLISQEDYEKVSKALAAHNMPIDAVKSMKPFLVTALMISQFIEGEPASFEGTFAQMAATQQKKLKGLESITDQLDIFDKIPYKDQAEDLLELVEERDRMSELFSQLIQSYHDQDVEGIYQLTVENTNSAEEAALILDQRNEKWIPRIGEYSADQVVFYGVGAAHLGGPNGVINLLRESNYTVTPIFE